MDDDALRAALAFYADPTSYTPLYIQGGFEIDQSEPVLRDGGGRARVALGMEDAG